MFLSSLKENLIFLLVVTSIAGIALGALLPVLDAIITENIRKEERGTVTSFYSSARFIGVAAGPPIMSLLMKNNLNAFYIASCVLGIILLFLVIKFIDIQAIGQQAKANAK